jgi:hypothetical protein
MFRPRRLTSDPSLKQNEFCSVSKMKPVPSVILPGSAGWFCVRTLPKHEHIAAAQLRLQSSGVEVFLPRIRYQRTTRRGPAWVTEALFLNYVFARFELAASLRLVQAARGVRGVVHFGARWPTIPETAIAELKAAMGVDSVKTLSQEFRPGDEVERALYLDVNVLPYCWTFWEGRQWPNWIAANWPETGKFARIQNSPPGKQV